MVSFGRTKTRGSPKLMKHDEAGGAGVASLGRRRSENGEAFFNGGGNLRSDFSSIQTTTN